MKVIAIAIAAVILAFLAAAGVKTIYHAGGTEERSATLQIAVEKLAERDKLSTTLRTATDEDFCRLLGGKTVNGECQ